MSKKIALIDGYGFVFRAYHALPPLTRSDGTQVGAVYGFTNMLIKLLAGLDVSHAAVVFDSGSKTFRNEIFPAYKANRPPCPEDLKPQFAIVRQAAESLNLAILEKVGFEADDIIATIAKKFTSAGHEALIVSSDKDLMQLVDEKTFMYDAMKNKFIGAAEVKEKFFVGPEKVLDVLAMIGDASDNIPGIRGIGPKTAAELITQFGTLENIFLHLDEIKQEKRRQLLADGVENAKLSKNLVTLKSDVEIGVSLADLEVKSLDPHRLISFLEAQGFRSLMTRVKKEFGIEEASSAPSWTPSFDGVTNAPHTLVTPLNDGIHLEQLNSVQFNQAKKIRITSATTFVEITAQALQTGIATIDYSSENDELDLVTISTSPAEIFYFKIKNTKNSPEKNQPIDLFNFHEQSATVEDESFDLSELKELLKNNSIKKIFFDAKSFFKYLTPYALRLTPITFEDLSLINHLLHSSTKNNLRELIELNLDEDSASREFGEMFDTKTFPDAEKKADFFCFRNFAIHQLYKIFSPKIFEQKLNAAYNSYELPLLPVLAQMEVAGIKIDVGKLRQLSAEFGKKISELSDEIFVLAGCEFNIASPKQLGEILFTKLGLTSSKKSKKTGALSTGVGVLEELEEEGHPIARKILEFRKFSKLKNTYTDALPQEINPKTGRIHTHLSTISTVTGRLSSSNPNLQNIPIKSAEGQKIREAFVAEKNHFLISADYSQIELRVIAHVAKIGNLVQAFKDDKDIHRITASQIFKIPESEIDEATRSKAKAINFGIIYGISAFGLARQLDISRQDAASYIKSYLETYPGIDSYMKNYIELARKNGYVETFSGRKCFIREINNKNPMIRNEAERLAINAPIQGSAADIIKKAMIRLSKKFSEKNLRAKMILQIHDELIVEAPENEVEIASQILKTEMENAFQLDVPLKADVKVGKCWR
jgi:DNA polymerase-1